MNLPFVKDVAGVGHTLSNKLMEALGDVSGFRTRFMNTPEGEVMLRTKGGMPEVTRVPKKVAVRLDECVKGPLIEIAFKYVDAVATTGYRRWFGESDPALLPVVRDSKYEWSSDGLLCIEARKLQKICFMDANNQSVDFLFAEKPDDRDTPADALPETDPVAAGSLGRFKFTEVKYAEREWYPTESNQIGWAFSGPTIHGEPSPQPASAVTFFIRRLRSTMFRVTDLLNKITPSKIKWIFANQTYTDRTLGALTTCANQNARELSFLNRNFFPPTEGNMGRLVMSAGLDEPPAFSGGPCFDLQFKAPGSFIAAIDPEGAAGNMRPGEVEKAIDLCEFSAFGNPWHGLVWFGNTLGTITYAFYKDSSKSSQWPFFPTPVNGLDFTPSGVNNDFRYFNVSGKNPTLEENIVRTSDASKGELRKDATLVNGAWYVAAPDITYWAQLSIDEHLYKDSKGTVWVIAVAASREAYLNGVSLVVTLKRRYGVLGTNFSNTANTINRILLTTTLHLDPETATVTFPSIGLTYGAIYANGEAQPDAKGMVLKVHCGNDMTGGITSVGLMGCYHVQFGGIGATVADQEHGIAIGDGIDASVGSLFPYHQGELYLLDTVWKEDRWVALTAQPVRQSSSSQSTAHIINTPENYIVNREEFYTRGYRIFLGGDVLASVVITQHTTYVETWTDTGLNSFFVSATVSNSYDAPAGYGTEAPGSVVIQAVLAIPAQALGYYQWARFVHSVNSAKAYSIFVQNWRLEDGAEVPMTAIVIPPSNAPAKLVYKEAAISVASGDLSYYKHTDNNVYAAKIGWAYDFHTKELLAIPFGNSAYFI